jgi:hypothetical protein
VGPLLLPTNQPTLLALVLAAVTAAAAAPAAPPPPAAFMRLVMPLPLKKGDNSASLALQRSDGLYAISSFTSDQPAPAANLKDTAKYPPRAR